MLCRREEESVVRSSRKVFAEQRGYRKVRRRVAKSKQKELELNVSICIEDELPDDPEVLVHFLFILLQGEKKATYSLLCLFL